MGRTFEFVCDSKKSKESTALRSPSSASGHTSMRVDERKKLESSRDKNEGTCCTCCSGEGGDESASVTPGLSNV